MFRLAATLGMTVAELLERISSSELTEWMAYFCLEMEEMSGTGPKRQQSWQEQMAILKQLSDTQQRQALGPDYQMKRKS